jgi:short-subunit dehydrogenase
MLQRGAGQVVPVVSLAGYRGLPKMAGYGASKAALIHAFDSFRFELAPRGIQVTLVTPGFVRTAMTSSNDPRPAIVEAPVAARIILDGVAQGRHEVHFPARLSWLIKLLRVLPYPIYERIIAAKEQHGGLGFHHDAPR